MVLTLWCIYFFRDPWRVTPVRAGLVVAPADGRVVSVAPAAPPAELGLGETPMLRIGIFLNVFDVHINKGIALGMLGRFEAEIRCCDRALEIRPRYLLHGSTKALPAGN